MKKIIVALAVLASLAVRSQELLPEFSVVTRGAGKTIISWNNGYPFVSQISIQRSPDSLRNYRTIVTVPDPHVPQNGFVDTKATTTFPYYRLFIVLDSGRYVFSKIKKPTWEAPPIIEPAIQNPVSNIKKEEPTPIIVDQRVSNPVVNNSTPAKEVKFITVQRNDSVIRKFPESLLRSFRDSMLYRTKDTLIFLAADVLLIRPFVPKEVYKPSQFVFTARDGNVTISLPLNVSKKYSVKFFEEDLTSLFEIKEVKETPLILDKTNFLHAGWFRFELYENGQLIEKHRLFIPKDF